MFVVIPIEKFLRDCLFRIGLICHDGIDVSKVLISQPAQALSNGNWVRHAGPDQPQRVNKRKPCKLLPLLTEIPELKLIAVLLPEADCLIANDKAGARHPSAVRCTAGQAGSQSKLSNQATQQIYRRSRGRIEFDVLDVCELATMRDYNAINRAIR